MDRRALLSLTLAAAAAPNLARASEGSGGGASSPYVDIPGLEVTISRGRGRGRGVLTVQLGMDVQNEAVRERATQSVPRIRAACNQVLMTFGAALLPQRVPDVERLARDLQAAVDQSIGRSGARVLLGSIMTT